MECPSCHGLEMETQEANDGTPVERCENCSSVWIDSGDLTRTLLRHNQPGLDSLGGRENLAETAGTCPDDLTDLVVIESRKAPDLHYAMCEVCGGIWLAGDEEAGRFEGDGEALVQQVIGFFQSFAPAKTGNG